MNTTAIACSSILLALASSPVLAQDDGSLALEGKHFTVLINFQPADLSKAIGQEILDTAEATWDEQIALYGLKQASMPEPWIIRAYRFTNQFDEQDEELNDGFAKEDVHYLFHVEGTKEIHLGLFPYTHDEVLAEYGLPLQCLRELIAKLTEVIREQVTEAPKLYPAWFTGGLDLLIAERVLKAKNRIPKIASDDPNMATYFSQVNGLNRQTRLPDSFDLILGKTLELEDRQAGLGYVWSSWMLAGKNKKRLAKLTASMLAIPADDGFAVQFEKIAKKNFKRGLIKNLNRDFKKYLRSVSSPWRFEANESQIMGDKILQIADEQTAASCVSAKRPVKPVYKISGTVTILKDWAAHQANLMVGKQGQDFVLVSFIANEDKRGIFVYHRTNDEWVTLNEFPNPSVVPGTPLQFQFEMRKQRHMVFILNGEEVFDFKFEPKMTGSWGLQADAGSAVLWEGVKLLDK